MSRTSRNLRLLGVSAALAAGFALQPATAQTVSNTGTGSAVVIPYYNVQAGWQTLVNVTNTTGNSLAVKFRMHEARNSRDVLDFNIALSPYDVWTATIQRGADGRPYLQTQDRSCTSPLSVRDVGQFANELAYSDFGGVTFRDHDATNGSITRMQEGYIELLVMGEQTTATMDAPTVAVRGDTSYYAEHVNGEPRDCDIVDADFRRDSDIATYTANNAVNGVTVPGQNGSGSPIARDADGNVAGDNLLAAPAVGVIGDPRFGYGPVISGNSLKVNASLINPDGGLATAMTSLHVANYGTNADIAGVPTNLVTAQQFPYFLEPTLAGSAGLWTTDALADVEAGISANSVANEWTETRATGVAADTEWVVTFPTKRFHVDEDSLNIQASCSQFRNVDTADGVAIGGGGPNYAGFTAVSQLPNRPTLLDVTALSVVDPDDACPLTPFTVRFQEDNDGVSNVVVSYTLYDREEGEVVSDPDETVPSPFPPGSVTPDNLSFEANVIKIGPNARNRTSVLGSPNALSVLTTGLAGATNGWMRANFGADLPVAGFAIKVRDFGNPQFNTSQGSEHAYTR